MTAGDAAVRAEAGMVVCDFIRLRPDETVAVLFDGGHRREADALLAAALEVGAAAIAVDVSQAVERMLASGAFWVDPPPHVLALLQATNVNVFTVDETYAFRLDHQVHRLVETGPACSVFKVDEGMGAWGITPADVAHVEEVGRVIVGAIGGGEQVRVTSPAGTDVTLSVGGRACLAVHPVPERGSPYGLSVPLWGEYNWAPLEDSANGVIVVDGLTEAGPTMKTAAAPVRITVRDGRAVAVEGGADADEFRAVFATDHGAAVVGELGVGGNRRRRCAAARRRRRCSGRCTSASAATTRTRAASTGAPCTSTASRATSRSASTGAS